MSTQKVKVEELTIEGVVYVPKDSQLSKVIELNGEESLWEIGKNYLIRTVTMIQLGKLKKVTDKELLLSDACWVADTGLFTDALKDGKLNEVEMFQRDVIVGRGGIIDATEWLTDLPKTRK
jgi:hypothetical protein